MTTQNIEKKLNTQVVEETVCVGGDKRGIEIAYIGRYPWKFYSSPWRRVLIEFLVAKSARLVSKTFFPHLVYRALQMFNQFFPPMNRHVLDSNKRAERKSKTVLFLDPWVALENSLNHLKPQLISCNRKLLFTTWNKKKISCQLKFEMFLWFEGGEMRPVSPSPRHLLGREGKIVSNFNLKLKAKSEIDAHYGTRYTITRRNCVNCSV